jgi:hypothetical protein
MAGLSDSLAAASVASAPRAAPKASRIGTLVAETIVLVNPQRNYAQFLLRAVLPMVAHVIIALAAGYRSRLRVWPAQHAYLARLRGRKPDRRAEGWNFVPSDEETNLDCKARARQLWRPKRRLSTRASAVAQSKTSSRRPRTRAAVSVFECQTGERTSSTLAVSIS